MDMIWGAVAAGLGLVVLVGWLAKGRRRQRKAADGRDDGAAWIAATAASTGASNEGACAGEGAGGDGCGGGGGD